MQHLDSMEYCIFAEEVTQVPHKLIAAVDQFGFCPKLSRVDVYRILDSYNLPYASSTHPQTRMILIGHFLQKNAPQKIKPDDCADYNLYKALENTVDSCIADQVVRTYEESVLKVCTVINKLYINRVRILTQEIVVDGNNVNIKTSDNVPKPFHFYNSGLFNIYINGRNYWVNSSTVKGDALMLTVI